MLFQDFFSKFEYTKIESKIPEENNRFKKKSKLKKIEYFYRLSKAKQSMQPISIDNRPSLVEISKVEFPTLCSWFNPLPPSDAIRQQKNLF